MKSEKHTYLPCSGCCWSNGRSSPPQLPRIGGRRGKSWNMVIPSRIRPPGPGRHPNLRHPGPATVDRSPTMVSPLGVHSSAAEQAGDLGCHDVSRYTPVRLSEAPVRMRRVGLGVSSSDIGPERVLESIPTTSGGSDGRTTRGLPARFDRRPTHRSPARRDRGGPDVHRPLHRREPKPARPGGPAPLRARRRHRRGPLDGPAGPQSR